MAEIRADQLRFTQSEVAEFVNDLMGFNLSTSEISAMHARTEGWIAGLQLAGLSMQDCKDIPGFISAFSGSHHYIVDYLAEEVLKRQDEQTRTFLLQSSILSRMCASLCESLVETGLVGSRWMGKTCWRVCKRRICSSFHWTRNGAGTATITCSPMHSIVGWSTSTQSCCRA